MKESQVSREFKASTTNNQNCLTISKPEKQFTVVADASDIDGGAVLSKPSGVTECTSRLLTSAWGKYWNIEKEYWTMVWTLVERITYLTATKFCAAIGHKTSEMTSDIKNCRRKIGSVGILPPKLQLYDSARARLRKRNTWYIITPNSKRPTVGGSYSGESSDPKRFNVQPADRRTPRVHGLLPSSSQSKTRRSPTYTIVFSINIGLSACIKQANWWSTLIRDIG